MAERNENYYPFKRTVLITGSTDGIGRQTALELAVRNKENFVIVHGRSVEKCEATINYIMREGKLPDKSNLDFVVADFSDLNEVSNLATEVEKRFPRLNVLLCNAGVLLPKRTESRNGLELTFQVNYLAHYILSRSLFTLLKDNIPSRLVLVSSICYEWYPLDWSDLQSSKNYEKYTQYSRTKLMIHLMTFKLARLFNGSGVICNVLEPGVIETKLLRAGGYSGAPVREGSRVCVFLCTSDSITASGAYYDNNCKRITKLFKDSVDEKQQENLWQLTEKIAKTIIRMAKSEEFPTEVEISENIHDSQYIRPMRMKFKRGDKLIKWDLILRHDSVACLLYHKQKQLLLFVKQFRPAVYITRVRMLDENVNKKWNEINWSKYPISMGETIELCAGLVDKPNVSKRKHMQEEILEECGYNVNEAEIQSIKTFVTGVGSSGALQELFYAEIDETMKVNEGGGVDSEKIDKIFMTIPEAQKYCDQKEVPSSSGMLYGLMWFFKNRM